jgi:hypothetical protein
MLCVLQFVTAAGVVQTVPLVPKATSQQEVPQQYVRCVRLGRTTLAQAMPTAQVSYRPPLEDGSTYTVCRKCLKNSDGA